MLTMAEKTFLGLVIVSFAVLAGVAFLPARSSYQVSLVTSPNGETFHATAGKPFSITCKGLGDNAEKFSSLKWLNKEGQLIQEGVPGTKEIEKNSLSLTFIEPKKNDSGIYKCLAVYETKDTLQKTVTILFNGDKPLFNTHFENVTAVENSYLTIFCDAHGEVPITYEWYNQYESEIATNSNSSTFVSDNGTSSVLIIPTVSLNDEGMYTCLAKNRHGLSSKIFQLIVLPNFGNDTSGNETTTEAVFLGASVANITATSVIFSLDVTGPVEYIEVQYKTVESFPLTTKKFAYGDDYEITNLSPASRYVFKFRVLPSNNSDWSNYYLVTLLPAKPEVIFRMVNTGTVQFEWFLKFEDRRKKTIDRHEISYVRFTMEGGTKWVQGDCPITILIPECAASSYTITGLGSRTYYEIQLRAHTASGYSEPYRQKIFFP